MNYIHRDTTEPDKRYNVYSPEQELLGTFQFLDEATDYCGDCNYILMDRDYHSIDRDLQELLSFTADYLKQARQEVELRFAEASKF
jgi:hypothetical protein